PELSRCDLRGLPVAFPSDHDDDHGGDARGCAAGRGRWRGLGATAAIGCDDHRRIDCQSGADLVHNASDLLVPRPLPDVVITARSTPPTAHERGLAALSPVAPSPSPPTSQAESYGAGRLPPQLRATLGRRDPGCRTCW